MMRRAKDAEGHLERPNSFVGTYFVAVPTPKEKTWMREREFISRFIFAFYDQRSLYDDARNSPAIPVVVAV